MPDLTDLFRQSIALTKLRRRVDRGGKLTPCDIADIGIWSEPYMQYIIAVLNGTPWQQAAREAIGVGDASG